MSRYWPGGMGTDSLAAASRRRVRLAAYKSARRLARSVGDTAMRLPRRRSVTWRCSSSATASGERTSAVRPGKRRRSAQVSPRQRSALL